MVAMTQRAIDFSSELDLCVEELLRPEEGGVWVRRGKGGQAAAGGDRARVVRGIGAVAQVSGRS